jgi:hypothetical protein
MKNPDRQKVTKLDELPNIGPSIAADLVSIGVTHPRELIGRDPLDLYRQIGAKRGCRQDPCLLDVLMATVRFMEGGDPLPWWTFTEERKRLLKEKADPLP